MVNEQDVLIALRAVMGPDGRTSLPDSGAILGLVVRDGKVYVAVAVSDAEQAKQAEPMRVAAEMAILRLKGVQSASVTLTAERTKDQRSAPQSSQGQAATQRTGAPTPRAIGGVKRIIAIASGKGGVGKSTTSVNLALALSAEGWRVGLLDADIYGPSAPRLFGLTGHPEIRDNLLQPFRAYGVSVMSIGFLVEERTAMVWRGPMVISALTQMLREVAWGDLDCLVVDMPPGTGDVQLTMAQAVPLSGAVIVSTPQDLALIDARRGISMFEQTKVPILGVIENMSYFLCPQCGARSDIFGHGGARKEAAQLGVPFLGEAPLDMAIRETSDAGAPIVASQPESKYALVYRDMARQLKTTLEGKPRRAPPKIIIE